MILLASACTKDIEYKGPDSKPMLVMNCIIRDGEVPVMHVSRSVFFLDFFLSHKSLDDRTTVDVEINGESHRASWNEAEQVYTDGRTVHAGDIVHITANHPDYPSVSATDTVPNAKDGEVLYFKGYVGIEDERIAFVSSDSRTAEDFMTVHKDDCKRIDATGKVVMPGFINTHTHVAMALLRGISDDVPLMEWLQEHIWPIEGKMGYKEIFDGARLGIMEMLLGGTTTFVDMYPYEEAVAEAAESAGIRAVVSPCPMDFRMEHFEKDWRAVHERFGGSSLVSMMMGPHAIYTLSEKNLQRSASLLK